MHSYHFIIASRHFFLNQEPIEEILRERTHYYENNNKDIDFWFVLNPKFGSSVDSNINIDSVNKPFAAIVSLDQQFIQWLKLRLVFVSVGSFKSNTVFILD